MAMNPISSRLSDSTNHTEHFDLYCLEFPVGPMVTAILCSPCVIVGVPASIWLLWVLVQRQRIGCDSSSDIYMINLTVMDVLANIQVLPYQLNFFVVRHELLLKILEFFYAFNMMGRPVLMACICSDCCMAVCYPISYMKMTRTHYRLVISAVAWAVTLLYGCLISLISIIPHIVIAIPFLTLPVMVCCDIAILCALRKPDPTGKTDVHPQKQRALQTITQSMVLAVMAFLPPLVAYAFTPLMPLTPQEAFCSVGFPAVIAPSLASVVMPLMYLHSLGRFGDLRRCGCGG